ncbi:unnamed protein product [Rhizophagus irregularis]|nr:unnamed protein product [Rhizophagus irregularis]
MPKHRSIAVSLVDLGSIVEEFHYGPYSRFCRDFFVTIVVGNKNHAFLPGYLCQSDAYISQIESDPSNAISSVYLQIFENGMRFSGPLVLGWQDEDIIHKLLGDVLFVPISIIIESLKIFIYGIGISSQVDWLNAGSGYKSSLIYKFNGNKQAIYVSKIEEDKCILEIYQDNQMKKKFEGETPIAVWKKSELMKKYNGNLLFGLENSFVQTLIHQHKVKLPICFPKNWNDYSIMKQIYNYHLKRRTIANLNWHQLFLGWLEQESPIIELYSQLRILYPNNHKFSDRELRAWQSMLRDVGSYNVTPWSNKESEYQFWSRSSQPEQDRATLQQLSKIGFLVSTPIHMPNKTKTFWNSFRRALDDNKQNSDGKRRVLSIIADEFSYSELETNLNVGRHTISESRKHARVNGYGAPLLLKPIKKM